MIRASILLTTILFFCPLLARADKFFIASGDVTGLIAAIRQANQNDKADTIYLALRGRYIFTTPIPAAFDGNSALPDVVLDKKLANKIIVYGNGSVLERDANAPAFRLWMVFAGSLELHDVEIRNGKLDGIFGQNGAGISDYGELAVYNSTFVNNTASFLGGALYIGIQDSPTVLTNCTITGNTASSGSAIYFFSSSASIVNCTIVGNPCKGANCSGLMNVLIIDDPNHRVFVKNSIVASNANNAGVQQDVSGTLISLGRNLIGANDDVNTAVYMPLGAPNYLQDYVGTSASPIDPKVNPLADNGGLTATMSIQPGSLAFNNGGQPAFVTPTDQAGNYRIGNAEIGSLELNNNPVLNPVIEIRQNATVISNSGHFDFGDVHSGQSSVAVEFKIRNTGIFQKLNLLSRPKIILTGSNAADFTIDQSMTSQEITANGGQTSFFVTFTPSAPGVRAATISIASNDAAKTIYTINMSGSVTSVTPVEASPNVTAVSPVCEGLQTSVTIHDSKSGVTYQVFKGSVAVSQAAPGGGDLTMPVPPSTLSLGNNTLKVLATKSGAGSDTLSMKPIVHVEPLTSIITQPSGATKTSGQSASITLTATGVGLTYQWRKGTTILADDSKFSGTASSTLIISNLKVADGGNYNCVATSVCGSITSSDAALVVNRAVPAITFTSSKTEGTIGDEIMISATSPSPGKITLGISGGTGKGLLVTPSLLRLEGPGTIELRAVQEPAVEFEGAIAVQSITVLEIITAVDARSEESVLFFPNPAQRSITVSGRADRVRLVEIGGAVVCDWKIGESSLSTLDVERVPPGLYLLIGQRGNDTVFLERLVKE